MFERPDRKTAPLVLFGAFDRHNLGDLLLAHMAAAEAAPRTVVFAGLAARDLRRWGGHRVEPIGEVFRHWSSRWPGAPLDVLHVGGETLTCDAYEAAVMLLPPLDAARAISRYDADRRAATEWARALLDTEREAPYVLRRRDLPAPGRIEFRAVGGHDLVARARRLQREVVESLREADALSVRDRGTRDVLARAGIAARLEPDPVTRVALRYGDLIASRASAPAVGAVARACPRGYLALQFAAALGDDATLDAMATALDSRAREADAGIVLFRAGAAPWHDDLDACRRMASRLRPPVLLFECLDIWDICALIAGARRVLSTSLHAGIVARAFGVETAPVPLPAGHPALAKREAYLATWAPGETAS